MAAPSPIQQLASDVNTLKSKFSSLQENIHLAQIRDSVEDIQTKVKGLSQRVKELRLKGYVFEKELDTKALDFTKQWLALFPSINQQINVQSTNFQAIIRPIEAQMTRVNSLLNNPVLARPILASAQSNINMLEDKITAAERTINGMFDEFANEVAQVDRHLDEIDYMLKQLSEATFRLFPTEAGIAAIKAVWCKTGKEEKDDPDGILFLTDQRVLFEQKEEIATKKVLFIATEKQKVQALLLEAPVALLDAVATSKMGLLKNENHIEIIFLSGAPIPMAHFHIWQDCATWQGLLNKTKSKEFDKDRAVVIDQAEVEKVKSAPTQCPSCGASLNNVILRGQETIKCEYCGGLIRL